MLFIFGLQINKQQQQQQRRARVRGRPRLALGQCHVPGGRAESVVERLWESPFDSHSYFLGGGEHSKHSRGCDRGRRRRDACAVSCCVRDSCCVIELCRLRPRASGARRGSLGTPRGLFIPSKVTCDRAGTDCYVCNLP